MGPSQHSSAAAADGLERPSDLVPVGQLMERSGLTRKLLRLSEEQGILLPAYVDPKSGYRYYSEQQVSFAEVLAALRAAGVPRTLIRRYATQLQAGDGQALDALKEHLYSEAQMLHERQEAMHGLLQRLTSPHASDFDIVDIEVPSQFELVMVRRVSSPEFPEAMRELDDHLRATALAQGGAPSGRLVGRCLDPVTEHLPGRVEFCLPVGGVVEPPPATALRRTVREVRASIDLAPGQGYDVLFAALEHLLQDLVDSATYDPEAPVCIEVTSRDPETVRVAWPRLLA